MHAAAASLGTAGRAAEELGEQLPRRHALGQRVPVPAMSAEDDVIAAQVCTNAGGDRLLADVSVAGSMNQAALVRARPVALRSDVSRPSSDKGQRAGRRLRSVGRSGGWRVLVVMASSGRMINVNMCRRQSSSRRDQPRISRFHLEHMFQVCDPENLDQIGMDVPDRESSADSIDPLFHVDQPTQSGTGRSNVRR